MRFTSRRVGIEPRWTHSKRDFFVRGGGPGSRADYRQYRFDDGRGGQRGVRLPLVFRRPVLVVRDAPDHGVRMTVVAHQRPHHRIEFRVHGQQPVLGGELLSHRLAGHGALAAADRAHVYPRPSGIKNSYNFSNPRTEPGQHIRIKTTRKLRSKEAKFVTIITYK